MRNKIISITEKVPKVTTLPDGYYNGIWGGNVIDISYGGKQYELKTLEGVVEIKDGVATYEEILS